MCYTDQEGEPGKNNHTNKGSWEFLKYEHICSSFGRQDRQILLFCSQFRMGEFFDRPIKFVVFRRVLPLNVILRGRNTDI